MVRVVVEYEDNSQTVYEIESDEDGGLPQAVIEALFIYKTSMTVFDDEGRIVYD